MRELPHVEPRPRFAYASAPNVRTEVIEEPPRSQVPVFWRGATLGRLGQHRSVRNGRTINVYQRLRAGRSHARATTAVAHSTGEPHRPRPVLPAMPQITWGENRIWIWDASHFRRARRVAYAIVDVVTRYWIG
jgi:hypothetical protein